MRSPRRFSRHLSSRQSSKISISPRAADTANGSPFSSPVGVERVVGTGDVLTWAGDVLLLDGEPLTLGGVSGYVADDSEPLAAAFDDAQADEVLFAGLSFVVEESQLWAGSHCKATLLRET